MVKNNYSFGSLQVPTGYSARNFNPSFPSLGKLPITEQDTACLSFREIKSKNNLIKKNINHKSANIIPKKENEFGFLNKNVSNNVEIRKSTS